VNGAVRPDVGGVLARLKGFQRATVKHAFERLYLAPDSTRRFLVADEVGLGKTLVARGVVARAIDHLWETIDRIDVVYICSNSQIARQNVNRLRLDPEDGFVTARRLTLLPTVVRNLRQNKVNYLALTPGTSFDLRSSLGRAEERVLLYWLLQSVWPREGAGPKNLFQGNVQDPHDWRRRLEVFRRDREIDPALAEAFGERLRRADLEGEGLEAEYRRLCDGFRTYRETVPRAEWAALSRLVGRFRSLLAETCIDALEPDLVILDEFQRFKTILDGDDDTAELARRLFTYSDETADVRLLLLSATPYKMYTLRHEEEEDDHYRDFLRTVEFLDPRLGEDGSFRDLLAAYRRELFRLEDGTDGLRAVKRRIEGELRRLMSRTERLRESADEGGMLREVPADGVTLAPAEVEDFVDLTRVGEALGQPHVIDYWKSAPYLLSFMDDYALKRELAARIEAGRTDGSDGSGGDGDRGGGDGERANGREANGEAMRLLAERPRLLLSWPEIEAYAALDPRNARLRSLLGWLDRTGAWKLLWLPPSLPYHEPASPFDRPAAAGLSKRLVFSTWTVVPKTLASLVSYHVERLAVGADEEAPRNTAEARRRRRPLLRMAQSQGRLTGMPVLAILYPSPVLAALGDPLDPPDPVDPVDPVRAARQLASSGDAGSRRTLSTVLDVIESRLAGPLARLSAEHASEESEREDEAWYWAAPLLLDVQEHGQEAADWLRRADAATRWAGEEDDDEDSRWADHVAQAVDLVDGRLPLGRPPENLGRVLAEMALAGPAVCALRALSRSYGGRAALAEPAARDAAGRIAWGMRALFNTPESMAIVRAGRRDAERPYWRQVLAYAAAGQLQAVLDEYVHTLHDLEGLFDSPPERAWSALAERVDEALTLRTGTPSVDEIRPDGEGQRLAIERRHLRNHFAIRFGAQETFDGRAGAREDQVRTAFNSPFWPFVLATTSVGQEGLDFHAYCHAVVHWNLPSNPVDLEQREGRVHRYKGHAVRKNVAATFGDEVLRRSGSADSRADPWQDLFELARARTAGSDHGLVPYWLFPLEDGAFVERHVPALPLSRETRQLEALKRSLAVYRMVFGQPRQDDLLAYLLDRLTDDQIEEIGPLLRIDLAPRR